MKRILSVILLVAMLVSTQVFAQSEQVSSKSQYLKEYEILSSLGIFEIFETDNYDGTRLLTRAETAAVSMRMLGINGYDAKDLPMPYTDVPNDHIYSCEIKYAYDLGIMEGYGLSFNPDGNVTEEQFIKVIVETLGYNVLAVAKGGYPTGYLSVAASAGILDGVDLSAGRELTHDKAVLILYNAIEAEVFRPISFGSDSVKYEVGGNILSVYLGIDNKNGVVEENAVTSLSTATGMENMVRIDGELYYTGDSRCDEYIGYNVDFYVKNDPKAPYGTILYASPDANNVIKLNSTDIVSYNSNVYTYMDGERVRKETIPKDVDIIYNGTSSEGNFKDYVPELGEVVIIDNDRDGKAEVLLITSYSVFLVNNCDIPDSEFYDKEGNKLSYKNTDWRLFTENGDMVYPEDVKPGELLLIAANEKTDVIRGFVLRNAVEGTISEMNVSSGQTYVTIGEKEYRVHSSCTKILNGEKGVGDSGSFFAWDSVLLEVYGSDTSFVTNIFYIIGIDEKKGLDNTVMVRTFSSGGEIADYKVSENVKIYISGEKVGEKEDLYAIFCEGGEGVVPQIAICDVNGQGEITYVEKAPSEKCDLYDDVPGLQLVYENTAAVYNYRSKSMDEGKLQLVGDGYVFSTPEDLSDLDDYLVESTDDFVPETSTVAMDIKAYRTGADILGANVVVGTDMIGKTVGDSYLLVSRISSSVTDEDEECYIVYGIENGNTEIKLKTVDKDVLDQHAVTSGDLIRYSMDSKGRVNHVSMLYDKSAGTMSANPSSKFQGSVNRVACGDVYKIHNGVIAMNLTKADAPTMEEIYALKDYSNIEYVDASKFSVIEFDEKAERGEYVKSSSLGNIVDYLSSQTEYSKIVVCWRNWGYPGTVIIYK